MDNIRDEELLAMAKIALENHEIVPFFQPQYNILTGMLIGAEALARWVHPELGIIFPGKFISLLEKNGLITRLDMSMMEGSCAFLRRCLDAKLHTVPISINLSREDIYTEGFIDEMEEIKKKYQIPSNLIRVEVVESIAAENTEKAQKVLEQLHRCGYVVELDDFGSGYSSLNVLKDLNYDVMKLDMKFLTEDMSGRGGTIVSSIVRMAKWLKMPVIIEGVENQTQLEFLKSIGCEYVQGFIYSRAVPQADFEALLSKESIGLLAPQLEMKKVVNPTSFWDYKSVETLVFNSYVGAAAVFKYDKDGNIEFLRVNHKYVQELQMNMSEEDVISSDFFAGMDEEARGIYRHMLDKAIKTEEEQECEFWIKIESSCCGAENFCIRANTILIGKSDDEYIFYTSIRNITSEKNRIKELAGYESQFKNVTEQANIYYWEYTVSTKEMRPCFRCMRDLGLPPLVTNYPEPAIEQGIFPADYADMYREWHRKIAAGEKSLEAVIPLTVGRVPFHVRYTTEFDELGRPVKAYGSATLVTPEEMANVKE